MAKIKVSVDYVITDGTILTFRTPCDCTEVTGLTVNYPASQDGEIVTTSMDFTFSDAHGNTLRGIRNLFMSGVLVSVILDVTKNVAYIQNADSNSYLDGKLGEDCVVAVGTSGIWTYRMWKSGIAECWGVKSEDVCPSDKWGEAHYTSAVQPIPFPADLFSDIPILTVTISESTGNYMTTKTFTTREDTGLIYVVSPTQFTTSIPGHFNLMAKGHWK